LKEKDMSKVKYTTMAGTANYPWLQPGRPDTAFDVEGKYKTELRMSATDAKDLVSVITGLRDEFPKAKHERVRIPFRTDEETGDIIFKVSSKFQPKYYDAKGNPVPINAVPLMYSGSTLKAGGMCESYTNGANDGVALRLGAIQIIDPVSNGDSGGSFEPTEGYTADMADNSSDDDYEF